MSLVYALAATLVGCLICGPLVTRSARRRGIRGASSFSVGAYMMLGLGFGEFIWLPFTIEASTSGHPLSLLFDDQLLISLPLGGIMGCVTMIATLYWGCVCVTLGLLSYRNWKVKLPDATRVYLPWVSLWTLAHMGYFFRWANSFG